MDTKTFTSVVREFADAFTAGERVFSEERYYKLRDDCPDWIDSYAMRAIHLSLDDRLPNDWVYATAASAAETLAEYAECGNDTPSSLHDQVPEIAESLVDVYDADLARWLAGHGGNRELVDEAVSDYGHGDSISRDIARGQYLAIERIAYAIVKLCEAHLSELYDSCGDVY